MTAIAGANVEPLLLTDNPRGEDIPILAVASVSVQLIASCRLSGCVRADSGQEWCEMDWGEQAESA